MFFFFLNIKGNNKIDSSALPDNTETNNGNCNYYNYCFSLYQI